MLEHPFEWCVDMCGFKNGQKERSKELRARAQDLLTNLWLKVNTICTTYMIIPLACSIRSTIQGSVTSITHCVFCNNLSMCSSTIGKGYAICCSPAHVAPMKTIVGYRFCFGFVFDCML